MDMEMHSIIMEDAYNGAPIDDEIVDLYKQTISELETACSVYGHSNGNGRLLGMAKGYLEEYLAYYNAP